MPIRKTSLPPTFNQAGKRQEREHDRRECKSHPQSAPYNAHRFAPRGHSGSEWSDHIAPCRCLCALSEDEGLPLARVGIRFCDYHLVLDEQAQQILATTDILAERVRKIGGLTIRSVGHIARLQRILDNDAEYVTPRDMLSELREDNRQFLLTMRETHELCDHHRDFATASVLEAFIDEAEQRVWYLFEMTRVAPDEDG